MTDNLGITQGAPCHNVRLFVAALEQNVIAVMSVHRALSC